MGGKPFQSKLEPHFDLICEARRKRETWHDIVVLLATKGITTSAPAIYSFMKRRRKRRYAFGMEPDDSRLPAVTAAYIPNKLPAKSSKLSELPEPPSEFATDPLTLPPKVKKKPMWGVVKPKPSS